MRAGDGDRRAQAGELAEQIGAVQLAQAALARARARGCRAGSRSRPRPRRPPARWRRRGRRSARCPPRAAGRRRASRPRGPSRSPSRRARVRRARARSCRPRRSPRSAASRPVHGSHRRAGQPIRRFGAAPDAGSCASHGRRPDRARRARGVRLRRAAARAARGDRGGARRARHARGHVDRLRQVGDLPDRRAAAAGRDRRRLAADRAPARAGRGPARAGGGRRGAAQLDASRAAEREAALAELAEDALEFVFLAPEQLAKPEVLDELAVARPSLLVVDEAHCISEWGHDFRPDYLRLGAAVEALGRPTVLALTATAAPPVRDEIVERLGLRDPLGRHPRLRPAEHPARASSATTTRSASCARCASTSRPRRRPGSSTSPTRRGAEELAAALRERRAARGLLPRRHAQRPSATRAQERFMDDELDVDRRHDRVRHGRRQAERALGRPRRDLRVARRLLPGDRPRRARRRAGRGDALLPRGGRRAAALLRRRAGRPRRDRRGAGGRRRRAARSSRPRCRRRPTSSETKLATALSRLEEVGAVELRPDGAIAPGRDGRRRDRDAIEAAAAAEERRRALRPLARRHDARLRGDRPAAGARSCSRTSASRSRRRAATATTAWRAASEAAPADVPFAVGARVAHAEWGEGVVQRYDDDAVVVLFDDGRLQDARARRRGRAGAAARGLTHQSCRRRRSAPRARDACSVRDVVPSARRRSVKVVPEADVSVISYVLPVAGDGEAGRRLGERRLDRARAARASRRRCPRPCGRWPARSRSPRTVACASESCALVRWPRKAGRAIMARIADDQDARRAAPPS